MNLRPYQHAALDAELAAWRERGVNRGITKLPTGMGKCLTPDSYVWDGGLKTFGSHWGGTTICAPQGSSQVNGWYDDGERDGLKVTLDNGLTLDGTLAHRVWVRSTSGYEGWRHLQNLTTSDYIAVARGRADFGGLYTPCAYALGLLIADGCIIQNGSQRLRIDKQHPQLKKIESSVHDWIRLAGGRLSNNVYIETINENHSTLTAYAPNFIGMLKGRYGVRWTGSPDREVPTCIMSGNRYSVREFLRGYFDGDGYCDGTACVSSASPTLIKQVSLLLLGLGVVNSVTEKQTTRLPAFILRVHDLDAFAREVGFTSYGVTKDLEFSKLLDKKRNTNVDTVPGVGSILRNAGDYVPSKCKRDDSWRHADAYYSGEKKPSYSTLEDLSTAVEGTVYGEQLRRLVKDNYFWVKPSSIVPSTAKRIDCEVDQQHSFIGNGIVNHNTVVFANKPDHFKLKNRMLVLVHREELAIQAAEKLRKWNPNRSVGVEMADQSCNNADLVVAGVATIGRKNTGRLKQFDPRDFDLVQIDEAHHSIGDTYWNVINHFLLHTDTSRLLNGCTATPNRATGNLADIYQEIVYDYALLDAIKDGWLANLTGFKISSNEDLDNVHTVSGDFNIGELTAAVNTPARNDLIVRAWLEHGQNRRTVGFTTDVQHAKDLALAFKRYGVVCEAVWGTDPHRAEKLAAHRAGHLKVITNCEILTEGYDDWQIGCIILARPTKSEIKYTQIIGRGTRIPEGINNLNDARAQGLTIEKEDCIILDVADVTSRHSLISLPSLFGFSEKVNLKGKTITQVLKEVDELKQNHPLVDLTKVEDIDKLESYAKSVDLFRVKLEPEVLKNSMFQWFKTGPFQYSLLLPNNSWMRLDKDLLEKWHVTGQILDHTIIEVETSFEAAIKKADGYVTEYGGKTALTLNSRDARWRKRKDPPTEAQLTVLRKFKIVVPPDATKAEVSDRISQLFTELKSKREARKVA